MRYLLQEAAFSCKGLQWEHSRSGATHGFREVSFGGQYLPQNGKSS